MERMKVTVLNGNPNASNSGFDGYLQQLSDQLTGDGHEVTLFPLREMDIKYCTGCFGCWVKTPGECVVADESRDVCRSAINSDFVLWASPVIMGFYSAELKKVTDKLIPLVHPYAEFVDGETHHKARYESYPLAGLLLEKGDDAEDEDVKLISDVHARTALNFKTKVSFSRLTTESVDSIAREITTAVSARRAGEGVG